MKKKILQVLFILFILNILIFIVNPLTKNSNIGKSEKFNNYNKMEELGKKYGTDKVLHHKYHEIYDFFLKSMYEKKGSILEIGIEDSYSLKMWLELFPNAFVYGIDIGTQFSGDRYQVYKCDQSNVNDLINVKNKIKSKDIFFINDDGSHIPEHQLLTFNTLFPILSDGGIYIIEDIETSYWTKNGLFGYKTRYGYKHKNSLVEIFKDVIDSINSEFSGITKHRVKHLEYISNITFSKNCIIITKKKQEKREYRFKNNL